MPAAPTEPSLRSVLARRAALALATLALAALALAALALAARADGYIYWANAGTNTIGRANLDGDPSSVNQAFIGSDGANVPAGVAVTGANIYWTNEGGAAFGTIGLANLDGSGVENDFVDEGPTIPQDPVSVAVDDQYLYWADPSEFLSIIGQAGVVPGNEEYRVGIDLSDFAQNPQFARLVNEPRGVAVGGGHLYWANHGTQPQTIGRADLENGNVSNAAQLIPQPDGLVPSFGASGTVGLAVDANYIYWANAGTNAIARADLNATTVDLSFIPGASSPRGWRSLRTTSTGRTKAPTRSGAPTSTAIRPASTRASSSFRQEATPPASRSTRCPPPVPAPRRQSPARAAPTRSRGRAATT